MAVLACAGPDWMTRVLTSRTLMRDSRTPGGGFGSPINTVCSASVACPAAPPSPTQYPDGSGSSACAGADRDSASTAKMTTAAPRMRGTVLLLAARYCRKDGDLVPILDRRVEPVQEADVLAAHVDVHEAAQVAVDGDAITEAVVAVVQPVEHLAHRGGVLDGSLGLAARDRPQLRWNLHRDRHRRRILCSSADGRLLDLRLERRDARVDLVRLEAAPHGVERLEALAGDQYDHALVRVDLTALGQLGEHRGGHAAGRLGEDARRLGQ